MKETKAMNSILVGLLLMVAVEAQAVDYKSTYKGGRPQPTYIAPATGTVSQAPTATFQSTSAMPVMMSTESMLNSDGTVNDGAYGVGQSYSSGRPGHIRKADSNGDGFDDDTGLPVENIDNPTIDPNDPGNVPLGEGLWVLLMLVVGYAGARVARKRTYADKYVR